MAAARDISREMDSLSRQVTPQERGPSPLMPPTLPFATRSVSPGPSAGPPSPRGEAIEELAPPRIPIGQRQRSGSGASSSSRGMDFPAPPLGARTISAAAFKRGPTRTLTAEGEVRKRTLPPSPYPTHRLNSTGSVSHQRDAAPQNTDETTNPPSSFTDGSNPEHGQDQERDVRQSMDVPPSYRSVESHNGYDS
jgi:hypothetical protein